MAKIPMKAVVYSLSPFQQKAMTGLFNDVASKLTHKVSGSLVGATLLLGPLVGVGVYTTSYQEKEKMEHRF